MAATSVRRALRDPRRLRTEVLAGLVVALALIPEAISFSIIAGVDPRVGLFASFTMAVTIAFAGGRPAMISAATGAIALVVAPLAREHGIDYLIATVLLGGLLQIVLSLLGVAQLMRFIPRSVMVGFVNALAILIFTSQVPHLIGVPWAGLPDGGRRRRHDRAAAPADHRGPGSAGGDRAAHGFAVLAGIDVPTVGDQGALPESLPALFVPHVPLTWRRCRSSARTRWRWPWSVCWSR